MNRIVLISAATIVLWMSSATPWVDRTVEWLQSVAGIHGGTPAHCLAFAASLCAGDSAQAQQPANAETTPEPDAPAVPAPTADPAPEVDAQAMPPMLAGAETCIACHTDKPALEELAVEQEVKSDKTSGEG